MPAVRCFRYVTRKTLRQNDCANRASGAWFMSFRIKRPVHLPFADFRLPERRAFLCPEEVRLNRRFAPGLYLGVSAISESAGVMRMDGEGDIVEYAVWMRQFAPEDELDRLLASGSLEPVVLRERVLGGLADALQPAGKPEREGVAEITW
jgi:hypothetical protein